MLGETYNPTLPPVGQRTKQDVWRWVKGYEPPNVRHFRAALQRIAALPDPESSTVAREALEEEDRHGKP